MDFPPIKVIWTLPDGTQHVPNPGLNREADVRIRVREMRVQRANLAAMEARGISPYVNLEA